jgi:hypothetical protein
MDITEFHSVLDSTRFGFNVAKVNEFNYPVSDLVNALKLNNYKLIMSKVSVNDNDLINELETSGFLLKDIQLTYKYDLSEARPLPLIRDVTVRDAELSDKDGLYQIAINSFEDYGHYAVDKNIDRDHCQEIYGDWIARSFNKKVADNITVAEINGEIAGFLSHKFYEDQFRYAVGGIGAVGPEFRNKNVFRAITIAGIHWAIEKQCQWVEHNVLITNPAVMRSFSKLNFKPANPAITFHKWL